MYMRGAHQTWCGGSLSRKRYTQYVEPNRTGHPRVLRAHGKQVKTETRPTMEEMMCAMAL
jgi:hypothetical protein